MNCSGWIRILIALFIISSSNAQSNIDWKTFDWGNLGIGHFQNAPFPDDSRSQGFKSDSKTYPYEGHYDDNAVAFVIPKGFQPGKRIDFVIIFHGHINTCDKFITDYGVGKVFCESKRNAILVIPQGPKNVPDSGGGKMEKSDVFSKLVNELLDGLKKDGKIPLNAKMGNFVVGGYSGGYRPLAFVLHQGGMKENLKEVWLFDAAYDFQDYLSEPFTSSKNNKVLRGIFTDHQIPYLLQITSNLSKTGNKFAMVRDIDLSTRTTSQEAFQQITNHTPGAKAGEEELPLLLRKNKIVLIHTILPHDGYKFTMRFLGDFLRASPNLQPIP